MSPECACRLVTDCRARLATGDFPREVLCRRLIVLAGLIAHRLDDAARRLNHLVETAAVAALIEGDVQEVWPVTDDLRARYDTPDRALGHLTQMAGAALLDVLNRPTDEANCAAFEAFCMAACLLEQMEEPAHVDA